MPKRRSYNKTATSTLKEWMLSKEHLLHPYPSPRERSELSMKTGLHDRQILNWFVNARKRIWQPLLAAMGKNVENTLATAPKTGKKISSSSMQSAQCRTPVPEQIEKFSISLQPENCNDLSGFPLRRGQWLKEEEAYIQAIIFAFLKGMLPISQKVTLRNYLAARLHCSPMRISKKFVGDAKIGKTLYSACNTCSPVEVKLVLDNLRAVELQFYAAVYREYALTLFTEYQVKGPTELILDDKKACSSYPEPDVTVPTNPCASEARQVVSRLLDIDESACDFADESFLLDGLMENDPETGILDDDFSDPSLWDNPLLQDNSLEEDIDTLNIDSSWESLEQEILNEIFFSCNA